MATVEQTVERYIATWNETDAVRRRSLIDAVWTEDGTYVDPIMWGNSPAEIDTMIAGVQQQFPDHVMRLAGPIDVHSDRLRFSWELLSPFGATPTPFIAGVDFGTLAADGRLRTITGFIDLMPG